MEIQAEECTHYKNEIYPSYKVKNGIGDQAKIFNLRVLDGVGG